TENRYRSRRGNDRAARTGHLRIGESPSAANGQIAASADFSVGNGKRPDGLLTGCDVECATSHRDRSALCDLVGSQKLDGAILGDEKITRHCRAGSLA